jgi:hypothetical protein
MHHYQPQMSEHCPTVRTARPPNASYYVKDGCRIGDLYLEDGDIKLTGIPTVACQEIAALFITDLCEDDRS